VSQYYHIERDLISGLFALASIVLLRSLFIRRRHSHLGGMSEVDSPDLEFEDEILDVTPEPDLPQPISECR